MTLEDFISTIKDGTMENVLLEIRDQENNTQFLCPLDSKALNTYWHNKVIFWFIPSATFIMADIVVGINMDGK